MTRICLALFCLSHLAQAPTVAAEEQKAQVLPQKEMGGQAACAQRLEAMLKSADFMVVDRSFPAERVAVRVLTLGDCRLTPGDHHVCAATASVFRAGLAQQDLRAEGESLGSWDAAMDEACRLLVDKVEASLVGKMLLPGESLADGERPGALVLEGTAWAGSRPTTCGPRLEAVLRRGGFRLLDRTVARSKAGLVVEVASQCTPDPQRRTVCIVQARVCDAEGQHQLSGQGSSFGSDAFALDEACRELALKLAGHLKLAPIASEPGAAIAGASARRVTLSVRWTGEPQPMPLLVLTRFFQRTGYRVEGAVSGRFEYGGELELSEPSERFAFLLESYLKNHYPSRCTLEGQSNCVCRLGDGDDKPLARLARLADELERLAARRADSRALDALPRWIWESSRVPQAPSATQRTALVDILAGEVSPRIKALALLWLAEGRAVADLDAIAAQLDDGRPAGHLPTVHISQQVLASYPVTWEPVRLGDVALMAIQRIVAIRFQSADVYRAWRKSQGDLDRSLSHWEAVLEQVGPEARLTYLTRLKQKHPDLFARLLLTRKSSDHDLYGWPEADLLACLARQYGERGLLNLLLGRDRWPEFADRERFAYFSRWVLQHWRPLLGETAAAALLKLWRSPSSFAKTRWVRRDLALAAAQANPSQRERILLEALRERPTEYMGSLLAELSLHHLSTRLTVIAEWFWMPDSVSANDNRLAVLASLSGQGTAGRKALRHLLVSEKFSTDDPQVIAALLETARKLGATDLRCPEPLRARLQKGLSAEKADAFILQAQQARAACLTTLRAWLKRGPS